jgi:hypothetical protein
MVSDPTPKASDESAEFPKAWLWDEDGETVSGTFVGFTQGQTRNFGRKVIVLLEIEGERRSIWLNNTVLLGKFRDELQDRPEQRLSQGERITITRLGKVDSAEAMGPYWKFVVLFHDRPEPSVEELFNLGGEPEPRAPVPDSGAEPAGADDDVPF